MSPTNKKTATTEEVSTINFQHPINRKYFPLLGYSKGFSVLNSCVTYERNDEKNIALREVAVEDLFVLTTDKGKDIPFSVFGNVLVEEKLDTPDVKVIGVRLTSDIDLTEPQKKMIRKVLKESVLREYNQGLIPSPLHS